MPVVFIERMLFIAGTQRILIAYRTDAIVLANGEKTFIGGLQGVLGRFRWVSESRTIVFINDYHVRDNHGRVHGSTWPRLVADDHQRGDAFFTNSICWTIYCLILLRRAVGRSRRRAGSSSDSRGISTRSRSKENKCKRYSRMSNYKLESYSTCLEGEGSSTILGFASYFYHWKRITITIGMIRWDR